MRRLAVAVCVLLAVCAAPAHARPLAAAPACSVSYTDGAGNERWDDAANWSTGVLPAATDDVCIPLGFPIVSLTAPVTINSLDAPSASLAVSADLTVGAGGATVAGLDVGAGTVSSAGPLAAVSVNLHGGELGGATIGVLRWSSGRLTGAATVTGQAVLSGDLEGSGVLDLTPAAVAHVARDTTLAVPLTNDGQLFVDGGVLALTGGSSAGSGSYQVAAGATLDWQAGTYALSAPAVTGAGTARVSGTARLATTGAASFDRLSWTGGTLAGAITAGALDVSGDDPKTLAGGTLALTGASVLDGGGALELDGTAQLVNGGVLDVRADLNVTAGAGSSPLVVNLPGATIRKSGGAGVTGFAVPLDNDGLLDAESGTIRLGAGSGAGQVSTGGYSAAAGARIDWSGGAYALDAPAMDGAGTALVSGAALTVTGAARAGATLAIGSGTARFSGPLTAGVVTVGTGGTLALPGGGQLATLLSSGTVRLAGARVTAGTYTQTAAGTLAETLGGGGLLVGGAAALDGTLTVDPGGLSPGDGASFPVIGYGSLTGRWATVAPLDGISFAVGYGADAATLTVHRPPVPIPEPTVTPPPPPPPPPPPDPGVRGIVAPDRGTVLVQLPPETGVGVASSFVALDNARSLPVGAVVDARKGQVTLTTASSFTDPNRPPTTLTVAAAIFSIRQTRATDGRTAVTDVILKTPPGLGRACLPPHKGVVRTLQRARPRVSHRTIRRVRVVAKGVVRAFGKVAVAATRNGAFELRDRCDGTSVRVSKGRTTVLDRIHGRTARLRARHTVLIRARLFAARRLHLKKVPRPRPKP